jgi:hypothetical protein
MFLFLLLLLFVSNCAAGSIRGPCVPDRGKVSRKKMRKKKKLSPRPVLSMAVFILAFLCVFSSSVLIHGLSTQMQKPGLQTCSYFLPFFFCSFLFFRSLPTTLISAVSAILVSENH